MTKNTTVLLVDQYTRELKEALEHVAMLMNEARNDGYDFSFQLGRDPNGTMGLSALFYTINVLAPSEPAQ